MHELVIFMARYAVVIPVLALIYVFIRPARDRRLQLVVLLAVTVVSAYLLSKVASALHNNPRPYFSDGVKPYFPSPTDNGFPSDHTLYSAVLALVVLHFSRKLGLALLVLAALIGTARVIAGVHHGIDVIGGLVIAGLSYGIGLLALYGYSKMKHAPTEKTKE